MLPEKVKVRKVRWKGIFTLGQASVEQMKDVCRRIQEAQEETE